jgi:hypothetical protein
MFYEGFIKVAIHIPRMPPGAKHLATTRKKSSPHSRLHEFASSYAIATVPPTNARKGSLVPRVKRSEEIEKNWMDDLGVRYPKNLPKLRAARRGSPEADRMHKEWARSDKRTEGWLKKQLHRELREEFLRRMRK